MTTITHPVTAPGGIRLTRGSRIAEQIRAARSEARLIQVRRAALAECSLTMLARLEAGDVPRHSAALDRVLAVLAEYRETGDAE